MNPVDTDTLVHPVPLLSRRPLHWRDISLSAIVAGAVAVLVSYAGPFLVVLQATKAADLSSAEVTSWVWAISIGSGLAGLVLSLVTRMPIIVAWSTPGAALLIASLGNYTFSDAIGAFLFASVAAAILGFTGVFQRLLAMVPPAILSALLAGILLPFVIKATDAVASAPVIAGATVVVFVLGKRYFDRYAVLGALVAGMTASVALGQVGTIDRTLQLSGPLFTAPTFDLAAVLAIGVPLLVVTMAAQNAPGLAVLRTSGYEPNDSLLVGGISSLSAVLTPFGGHAINLAAITAAICSGDEAHRDPARRYVAGVACGFCYLVIGTFSAGLVSAFQAVPPQLVAALAGVALLGALLGALTTAVSYDAESSTAALITLCVTASGVVAFGIGSAFWGLVAGVLAYLVLRSGKRSAASR